MSLAAELVETSSSTLDQSTRMLKILEEQCANYSLNKQLFHQQSKLNATTNILLNNIESENLNNHHLLTKVSSQALPLSKLMLNHFQEPCKQFESTIDYYFNDFWQLNGDERTSKLPFMSAGPWKLIYATLIYLYLIKVLLPSFMSKRKAFELNWPIRIYNLLMVFSNMYAFYHGSRILNFGLKCFGCQIVDGKDYSLNGIELLHYGWLFVMSRIVEWLDTIFFVLRKKDKQITKLHVFHHSFVPIFSWIYLKFLPGYWTAFFPFINTFVHTTMYSYYFLATFGQRIQPYLWWKKYLTKLQIAQFVLILIQLLSMPLSANESCQMPRSFLIVALAGAFLFLWLFYTYYMDTYTTKESSHTNTQKRVTNLRGSEKIVSTVEGSSTALADSIDNAIVSGREAPESGKSKLTTTTYKKLV